MEPVCSTKNKHDVLISPMFTAITELTRDRRALMLACARNDVLSIMYYC